MYAGIDENGYFNGAISENMVPGGVKVSNIPPYDDVLKQTACKLANGSWVFDEDKYNELLEQEKQETVQITPEKILEVIETVSFIDEVMQEIILCL